MQLHGHDMRLLTVCCVDFKLLPLGAGASGVLGQQGLEGLRRSRLERIQAPHVEFRASELAGCPWWRPKRRCNGSFTQAGRVGRGSPIAGGDIDFDEIRRLRKIISELDAGKG